MMRNLIVFLVFFSVFVIPVSALDKETDSLMHVYDELLSKYEMYIAERHDRIDNLKFEAGKQFLTPQQLYSVNQQIYKEYRPYISDSAIVYLKKNIALAEDVNNVDLQIETKIQLAYLLASIGLYKESIDLLDEISEVDLTPNLLLSYYSCMEHTYGELSFYSKDPELSNTYRGIADKYKNLQLNILPRDSDLYLRIKESDFRSIRDFKVALEFNDKRLQSVPENSHEYAVITFLRSLIYKESGDIKSRQKWLFKSAIADLKLGITDNASSWELAGIMFELGDVNRAYQYINYSVNNANIFNARLRYTQIAEVQAIINNAYQLNKAQQEKQLRTLLRFISLLTLLLLLSGVGILFQNRKISKVNKQTVKINDQLNRLNWELSIFNEKIKNTNAELLESNQVKEEYIGHFLSLCSFYIDKMDSYRKSVRKKLSVGKLKEVIDDAKSTDFIESELKEFYDNFDRSFLRLYPDFVSEFNDLLMDDEKIILKKDELLNTELRIFALIRLGIDNSAKIAELLHYSSNTIYNYRAKIKNKAKVSRNDFEMMVKKIGTFTK
ncbi:MAG TPA: DUF6377 domain-containing protein [Paludibacter sp.]|nr:DUF6377 domain-containing protein [Paludibacter sp.]